MEWACRDCGNSVSTNDVVLIATMGWTSLDGDTGICPACTDATGEPGRRVILASRIRIEESRRQLAAAREIISRARREQR